MKKLLFALSLAVISACASAQTLITGPTKIAGPTTIPAATAAGGPIVFVSAATRGTGSGTGTTSVAASAFSVTAGNNIAVGATNTSATISVTGVSDTAGNTFVLCTGAKVQFSPTGTSELWVSTTQLGNASDVVTVTWSSATTFQAVMPLQYSGVATGNPCDSAAVATGTAASPATAVTTGSFTPGTSGEVCIGVAANNNGSGSWTAGTSPAYTARSVSGGNSIMQDLIGATTSSQTASITNSVGQALEIAVGCLKP